MPRRAEVVKRDVLPDPKYNSKLVAKFINFLMARGKKSVARAILYDSIDIVEKRTNQDGLTVFHEAINNVKPVLEIRSRRVGGATYQVPVDVKAETPHNISTPLDHSICKRTWRKNNGRAVGGRTIRRRSE